MHLFLKLWRNQTFWPNLCYHPPQNLANLHSCVRTNIVVPLARKNQQFGLPGNQTYAYHNDDDSNNIW